VGPIPFPFPKIWFLNFPKIWFKNFPKIWLKNQILGKGKGKGNKRETEREQKRDQLLEVKSFKYNDFSRTLKKNFKNLNESRSRSKKLCFL
jgi:hypothetical protein